ncbi:AlpA family phage regulatory protein [Photobacterium kishitanii]|uniref:helix-turn-helix transcriptional regulator n=1 Tax=Photobacterium kishitanii TaxID=318456 RepID=UPI0009C09ED1|nr:AlpA family phage regulatory protein [Photobacterium kishitanii]PSW68735.1 AlpA family phage regulatory protein [Photobacterium kishitanii]
MKPILKRKDMVEILGISRVTLWRYMTKGVMPSAVIVNGRILGWKEKDIEDWLSNNTKN